MDPIAAEVMNMDGQGLTTSTLAGIALSHLIRPYMDRVPTKLKPLVPIVGGIATTVVACMSQGMAFGAAFHYGVLTAASALVNHRLAFAKAKA